MYVPLVSPMVSLFFSLSRSRYLFICLHLNFLSLFCRAALHTGIHRQISILMKQPFVSSYFSSMLFYYTTFSCSSTSGPVYTASFFNCCFDCVCDGDFRHLTIWKEEMCSRWFPATILYHYDLLTYLNASPSQVRPSICIWYSNP